MGTILSYPDLTLASTLSGGSWDALLPLDNLKNQLTGKVARSTDCVITSTVIIADTGVPDTSHSARGYSARCIAVIGHNITPSGTIRARGYSDSGLTIEAHDSGEQFAYSDILTPLEMTQVPNNWIYVLLAATEARYWKIEIRDIYNPAGYIELGRLWIGEGFEPETSISYGANLGYEPRDLVDESIGGVEWAEERTPKRATAMQFETLTDAEKRKMLLMQKVIKRSGEMLYIFDSEATPENMQAESYLCKVKQASRLDYPYFDNNSMPLELTEITNSQIVRTLLFIVMLDMPLESDIVMSRGTGSATFTRASGVNVTDDNGELVVVADNTPTFNVNGILIEPASTNKCTCYGVPRPDSLGSELQTNGNFSNATYTDSSVHTLVGWGNSGTHNATNKFTISGGQCTLISDGTNVSIYNTGYTLTVGKYYTVTLDVIAVTGVGFKIIGGASDVLQISSTGSKSVTFMATTPYWNIARTFGGAGGGTFDNVSIKEAIDYVGTKAYHDGTTFQNPITGMTLSGSDTLGTEMLTNPDFSTGTTGWTPTNCTIASVAGGQSGNCLQVTTVSGTTQYIQSAPVTTVVGTRYRLTIYVKSGTSGNETATLLMLDSSQASIASTSATTSASFTNLTVEFTATTTVSYMQLRKVSATAGTMLFDTASFKTITYPAELSIVNDQSAIDSAITSTTDPNLLIALQTAKANGYKVYKLDNTTGASAANVFLLGSAGNMNAHLPSVVCRATTGSALIRDGWTTATWVAPASISTVYNRNKPTNAITPGNNGTTILMQVAAASITYFLAPQLEESSVATSPMLTEGATKTRAAAVLSAPTAGNIQVGSERLELEWTPNFSTAVTIGTQTLWSSYTDANNELSINYNGVILYALKKVAGVSEYVTIPLSAVAYQTYRIALKINLDGTMKLSVDDVWDLGGLGSELITNGGFDTDSVWTKGTGWTIGSGVASASAASSALTHTAVATNGKLYSNTFTIVSISAGSFSFRLAGDKLGAARTAVGTYTDTLLSATSSGLFSAWAVGATGTIDNFSVKELYNNTTTLTPVIASTMQIGGKNGAFQTVGRIKLLKSLNRSF